MKRTLTARNIVTAIAVLGATICLNRPAEAVLYGGTIQITPDDSATITLRLPVVKNAKKPFHIAFFDQNGQVIARTDLVPPAGGGVSFEVIFDIKPKLFGDGSVRFVIQKRGSNDSLTGWEEWTCLTTLSELTLSSTLYSALDENGKAIGPLSAYILKFDSSGRQIALLPYIEGDN
jgi:hypothetical protein